MTVEMAESSRAPVTTGAVSTVLRLFVEIGAGIKGFFQGSHPASAGSCTESAVVETVVVATVQVRAPAEVRADAGISAVAHDELDEQEIERRRNVVRTLFNDFWSGVYEKPAAFVERLDQAEDYVNERLAETGEFWQLDAKTRVTLGLPPRLHSPNNLESRAARG